MTPTMLDTLAAGVTEAHTGHWTAVSISTLLGDPADGCETREALSRQPSVRATRTWRAGWTAVAPDERVRVLTLLVAAARRPTHPRLVLRCTDYLGVCTVTAGGGVVGALHVDADGSAMWIALFARRVEPGADAPPVNPGQVSAGDRAIPSAG